MQLTSHQIIESIPLGLIIISPDGQIVDVNPALLTLLGYHSKEQLKDQPITSLFSEDGGQGGQEVLNALHAGKPTSPYLRELITADGETVPVEIHAGAIQNGMGEMAGAILAVRNLTEEMKQLKALQRRNAHLLASSEVAKAATQILDIRELLTRCVDLIRIHFGFYYAAIFLVDEAGEWAILRAATGEAGLELLKQGHKLGVGSKSMVGWVTANNAARIALDVGEEAIRFDNPLLPKTRSEMALPLRVRGEVIGALDVQSTSLNAFTPEDIQTIQMMADQVAIAIDNARLFSLRRGV
jgi:PAS domain S-box-containing protein